VTTANDAADATPAVTLEAVLDALYRGPRERFVTERNAAAKRLRGDGFADEASEVKARSKPSVSAWAVNQLWWTRRGEVEALLECGRHQAESLRAGAGPAEQASTAQARRRALDRLVSAAAQILGDAGNATGASTLRRISITLEALTAHLLREGGPHPGRLSTDLDPPGFELLSGWAGSAPSEVPLTPAAATIEVDTRAAKEAAIASAQRARTAARERTQAAAQVLDEATRRADDRQLTATKAEETHRRAHIRAEEARHDAEAAELSAHRARAAAAQSQQEMADARRTLQEQAAALRALDDVQNSSRGC